MKITAEQREIIRVSVLKYCEASGEVGFSEHYLVNSIQAEGFRSFTSDDLRKEVLYLEDKKLVTPVDKAISPENRRWRCTAEGVDFLASQSGT